MNKFDVIVIGAGPAGSTAAIALAKSGFKVAIIERGEEPGAKNSSGGVLYYSEPLDKLVPDFWQKAPLERCITRNTVTFLTPDSSVSLDYENSNFAEAPYNGFSVLRSKFDQWYANQAVEAGAFLIPETTVDDVIWDNGKVAGVMTRRENGALYADAVIIADGTNSIIAQKAGLQKEFSPDCFSVSAKEVLTLPGNIIEERFNLTGNQGIARTFIGASTGGVEGGAFIYTNKTSLSVGVVAKLTALKEKKVSIAELLETFKNHPLVSKLLKGAELIEYSGHLIPENGIKNVPKLYNNGIMVVGDAAGLLCSTGFTLEGMNFAIASAFAAAETLKAARQDGNYSADKLALYQTLLENSFVLQDLKSFKRVPDFLTNPQIYEIYPSLISGILGKLYRVNGNSRKKLWTIAKEEIKSKTSLWRISKDLIKAGRALL